MATETGTPLPMASRKARHGILGRIVLTTTQASEPPFELRRWRTASSWQLQPPIASDSLPNIYRTACY
jgi:hypothetical protein